VHLGYFACQVLQFIPQFQPSSIYHIQYILTNYDMYYLPATHSIKFRSGLVLANCCYHWNT